MSHMVIYRGSDGKPGYHQTDDIHDAVGFVERMRNDSGVEHARIFRLEEVVFEYKPYYRVELSDAMVSSGELAVNGDDHAGVAIDAQPDLAVGHVPGTNGSAIGMATEEATSSVAVVDAATDQVTDVADTVVDEAVNEGPKRGLFGR